MTTPDCIEHPHRHQAGCRPCQIRSAAKGRERTRAIAYGTHRGFQDIAPAKAHAAELHHEHGMAMHRIAKLAGVERDRVRKLLAGQVTKLRPETYDRIMAVRPEQRPVTDHDRVPALGAARMLQALAAAGHHNSKVAAELGVAERAVARWRRMERQVILASSDRAIRAVYDRLSAVDGGDTRTRAYARSEGWAPPSAWDGDEDLDNPDAQPDLTAVRDTISDVLAGRQTADAFTPDERLRVVEYLTALGYTDRRICERLRWSDDVRVVAQYRRHVGLPPGSHRTMTKGALRYAREKRRERFLQLSPRKKSAAIDRFDFDGETAEDIALAVGCSASAVENRRSARRAHRDPEPDPVAVDAAMRGAVRFGDLNRAEKRLLFATYGPRHTMLELTQALRISADTCRAWMNQAVQVAA